MVRMPLIHSHHVTNYVFKTLYICKYLAILQKLKMQKFEPVATTSATFHLSYRHH